MGDSGFGSGSFGSSNFGLEHQQQIGRSADSMNSRIMGSMPGANNLNPYSGSQNQLGLDSGPLLSSGSLGMSALSGGLDSSPFGGQSQGGPGFSQQPRPGGVLQQPPPPPSHHRPGSQGNSLGGTQVQSPDLGFDLSDFPTLASGMTSLSLDDAGSGVGGALGQGTPFQGSFSSTAAAAADAAGPGFAIQSEDFPALPGSGGGGGGGGGGAVGPPAGAAPGAAAGGGGGGGGGGAPRPGSAGGGPAAAAAAAAPGGAKAAGPGSGGPSPSMRAGDEAATKYGLLGLLGVIRMADPDRTALALGADLTALGLDLNSAAGLYATFAGPWARRPAPRPHLHPPPFALPRCYRLRPPPAFRPEHLPKLAAETLLYLFYALPRDVLQARAAQELYNQDWRYHGELKLWFKRAAPAAAAAAGAAPPTPPGGGAGAGQPAAAAPPQFVYFDAQAWERRAFAGRPGALAAGFLSEEEVRARLGAADGGGGGGGGGAGAAGAAAAAAAAPGGGLGAAGPAVGGQVGQSGNASGVAPGAVVGGGLLQQA